VGNEKPRIGEWSMFLSAARGRIPSALTEEERRGVAPSLASNPTRKLPCPLREGAGG
jgi:hypothetical protein